MTNSFLRPLMGVSAFRLLGAICAFATTIFAGRILGSEVAGTYFWIISTTAIISSLSRLGLDKAYIRLGGIAAQNGVNAFRTVANLIKASCLLSTVLAAIFYLYLIKINGHKNLEPVQGEILLIVLTPCVMSASIILGSFELGSGRIFRGTLSISFIPTFITLLLSLIIFFSTNANFLTTLIISTFSGWMISVILSSSTYLASPPKEAGKSPSHIEIVKWKKGLVFFGVIGLSNILEQWLPTLISGIFFSASNTAQFGAASRIISVIQMIMASAAGAFSYRYISASDSEILSIFKKTTISITSMATPILIGAAALSPYLLELFGNGFREGYSILSIQLIAQLINILLGSSAVILMMRGHVALVAKVFGATSVLLILSSVIAGYMGSPALLATASALATVLQAIGAAYYFKKIYAPATKQAISK